MTQPYGQQPQQPGEGQPSNNPQQQPSTYPPGQSGRPDYQSQHGQPPEQGQPEYGQQAPPGYGQNQPGYGQPNQPGYGQPNRPPEQRPGYGQQNYAPEGYPRGAAATTKGRPNVVGLVLAVIAAVLGILSLFVLGWYRNDYGSVSGGASSSSGSKFSKIHDALTSAQNQVDANPAIGKYLHFGISPTYFGWLGYLLIAAAVVLAIIACLPTGGLVMLFKVLTAIVSLAGIGLTLWAIDLISFDPALRSRLGSNAPSGYGDWLKHTSFGAWAMGLAFLLCLIVALIPPKKIAVLTDASGRY